MQQFFTCPAVCLDTPPQFSPTPRPNRIYTHMYIHAAILHLSSRVFRYASTVFSQTSSESFIHTYPYTCSNIYIYIYMQQFFTCPAVFWGTPPQYFPTLRLNCHRPLLETANPSRHKTASRYCLKAWLLSTEACFFGANHLAPASNCAIFCLSEADFFRAPVGICAYDYVCMCLDNVYISVTVSGWVGCVCFSLK